MLVMAAGSLSAQGAEKIKIGTEGAYPPFNYANSDGTLGGFDIDLGKALCAEMKADCDKIKAGENNPNLGCFAGQYNKYEGLTVNFDEAVHSAGGVIVGDDGKPNVSTPEAAKGLQTLLDRFLPQAAPVRTGLFGRLKAGAR